MARKMRKRGQSPVNLVSFCSHGMRGSAKLTCSCGEMKKPRFDWKFCKDRNSESSVISRCRQEVQFSSGNGSSLAKQALAVGEKELKEGEHHFWEFKVTCTIPKQTSVRQDFCIGVASRSYIESKLLSKGRRSIVNNETGFVSYAGNLVHPEMQVLNGDSCQVDRQQTQQDSCQYNRGSIIGLHFDGVRSTLSLSVNRTSTASVSLSLKGDSFYPVITSSFNNTGVKLMYSVSYPDSLEFKSAQLISKLVGQEIAPSIPDHIQALLLRNYPVLFPSRAWDDLYIALEKIKVPEPEGTEEEGSQETGRSEKQDATLETGFTRKNQPTSRKVDGRPETKENVKPLPFGLRKPAKLAKKNGGKSAPPRQIAEVRKEEEYLSSDDEYVFIKSRTMSEGSVLDELYFDKVKQKSQSRLVLK